MSGITGGDRAPAPPVRLVVMDFDDTLYDWIGHFVPALDAMVKAAAPLLQTSEDDLRRQLKAVHEHYGNTEQPFALLETESAHRLLGGLPRDEQRQELAPAFAAFDKVRKDTLRLYDDVVPALDRLRRAGIALAGYSAAPSVNLAKRVKMLDLSRYFSRIYASPFTGKAYPGVRTSAGPHPEIIELSRPKPDPEAVRRITGDFGMTPIDALFVGDSLASDIAPAVADGARAALIQRPTAPTGTWLPDLLKVSHRTAETRADSANLSDADLARIPTIRDLSQLWNHFVFTSLPPEHEG